MAIALGLRDERLPIGYAVKRSNKLSYYIIAERLVAYKNGSLNECLINGIENKLNNIINNFSLFKDDLMELLKAKK